MSKIEKWILGVHVTDRVSDPKKVQPVLTKFGCSIKTRLGLHDITLEMPSSKGLLLLELTGDPVEFVKLENELLNIEGLDVKKMIFTE